MESVAFDQVHTAAEKIQYKDSTYEIVSKVAYLIGVPLRIFENEHEAPQMDVYQRLEKDKNARIIRNLCIIRTEIERNFKKINDKMRTEYKSLLSMPEYVSASAINALTADGINFIKKSSTQLSGHIVEINRIISDRINNCKSLFPLWLNWPYVRELFIMPNGLSEKGSKDAAAVYYESLSFYPYQVYINWRPYDAGNILYNDKKFVTLLYEWNNDEFTEYSKVSDAGTYVKGNIHDYINDGEQVVVVVDCENSDPYRLSATLWTGRTWTKSTPSSSLTMFIPHRRGASWNSSPTSPWSISPLSGSSRTNPWWTSSSPPGPARSITRTRWIPSSSFPAIRTTGV